MDVACSYFYTEADDPVTKEVRGLHASGNIRHISYKTHDVSLQRQMLGLWSRGRMNGSSRILFILAIGNEDADTLKIRVLYSDLGLESV